MSKDTIIQVRVSEEEKALILKAAKREGLNIPDYIRMVVYADMTIFGPTEVWRKVVDNLKCKFAAKIKTRIWQWESIDAHKVANRSGIEI